MSWQLSAGHKGSCLFPRGSYPSGSSSQSSAAETSLICKGRWYVNVCAKNNSCFIIFSPSFLSKVDHSSSLKFCSDLLYRSLRSHITLGFFGLLLRLTLQSFMRLGLMGYCVPRYPARLLLVGLFEWLSWLELSSGGRDWLVASSGPSVDTSSETSGASGDCGGSSRSRTTSASSSEISSRGPASSGTTSGPGPTGVWGGWGPLSWLINQFFTGNGPSYFFKWSTWTTKGE